MRPFAFALSIRLYTVADMDTPLGVSAKSQFFLPTEKGRMAFSAACEKPLKEKGERWLNVSLC